MKKRSISLLAASLLVLTVSQSASAQETPEAEAQQAAPASTEDTATAAAQDEAAASGETEESGEVEESAEPGDVASAEAGAPDEADATAESAAATPQDGVEGDAKPAEPRIGPGGKPLREDYPGTEESKKARMDTERIEGLTFNEGETAEDVYDLRIRELETKVDDLKETVFRSKTRIVLLKETVLNGTIAGSRAIVSHINELGSTYVLEHALYSLDGSRVFNEKNSDGSLNEKAQFDVYKGAIAPGTHRLSVMMELKGSGFKVFNYMDGYKFKVQDSCEFTAQEGRGVTVELRLYEKGGAFSSYEDKLGVDCTVNLVTLSETEVVDAKKDVETDTAAAATESAPDAP